MFASFFVTPDSLRARLETEPASCVLLDARWVGGRAPLRALYEEAHIPGARLFDIDTICDSSAPFPHMVASPEHFEALMNAMGISSSDTLIVYDQLGCHLAAPRVWWNFRLMGHASVYLLEGGLRRWQALGLPLASGPAPAPAPARDGQFKARFVPERYLDYGLLREWQASRVPFFLLDNRSPERFSGAIAEPRPDVAAGAIEGSVNVPFEELCEPDFSALRPAEELRARFASCGLPDTGRAPPSLPVVTTCGSGVTACIAALALEQAGLGPARVYDGSWTEYALRTASTRP